MARYLFHLTGHRSNETDRLEEFIKQQEGGVVREMANCTKLAQMSKGSGRQRTNSKKFGGVRLDKPNSRTSNLETGRVSWGRLPVAVGSVSMTEVRIAHMRRSLRGAVIFSGVSDAFRSKETHLTCKMSAGDDVRIRE